LSSVQIQRLTIRIDDSNLDARANKTLVLLSHSISVDLIGVERDTCENLKLVGRKRTVLARNANNAKISSSPYTQSARNSLVPSNTIRRPQNSQAIGIVFRVNGLSFAPSTRQPNF
jgi:hypothetical protein